MNPQSDEEALLAAIDAAPFDAAPRLVYADWLDEQGADAKAGYLRAAVALLNDWDEVPMVRLCEELAPALDPMWRQRVAGQFEILLEGPNAWLMMGYLFQAILQYFSRQPIDQWHTGRPIRLKVRLTPEDAAESLRDLEKRFGGENGEGNDYRLIAQPMADLDAMGLMA